jgi:hypothetical protein
MLDLAFYLDEDRLQGITDRSIACLQDIQEFCDTVEEIAASGQTVSCTTNIDCSEIGSELKFFDVYSFDFSESDVQHELDRDTHQRLLVLRSHITCVESPQVFVKVIYPGGEVFRPRAVSWLAGGIQAMPENINTLPCVISLTGGCPGGALKLIDDEGSEWDFYCISKFLDLKFYIRWLIKAAKFNEEKFFEAWDLAFPHLHRQKDLSFRRFHGNYANLVCDVISHLSFLNDNFSSVLETSNGDFHQLIQIAKSGYGIDFSNESTKTRASPKKMKERDVEFGGKTVRCELHSKISPTQNRIHFPPPNQDFESKVLIGIFVNHLTT